MPKISVIMPVYNGERYLKEAIDSILSQTYGDFELIIIDDGSTDATEKMILAYQDHRIRYDKNEKNLGVAASLNRGLDLAKGEYVARMDADDISLSDRFEKQVNFMEAHPEVGVLGGAVLLLFPEGTCKFPLSPSDDQIRVDLLFNSAFAHPAVMIRRSVLTGLRYEEEFIKCEDYRLWTKLAPVCKMANLSDVILQYRQHDGQVTQIQADTQRMERIRKDYLKNIGELEDIELFMEIANGKRVFPKEKIDEIYELFLKFIKQSSGFLDEKCCKQTFRNIMLTILQKSKCAHKAGKYSALLGIKGMLYVSKHIWRK